jgi:hypothetical protein
MAVYTIINRKHLSDLDNRKVPILIPGAFVKYRPPYYSPPKWGEKLVDKVGVVIEVELSRVKVLWP